MTLTEHEHGSALDLNSRRPIQMHRQRFVRPIAPNKHKTLGTFIHTRLDGRGPCVRNMTRVARPPLDLSTCQAMCMILLEPQPHRATMHPSILGDGLALPPPMGHQDRLTPVAEASVISCFEDLFQLRLFC